jgi:hypothetical protein
MTQAASVLDSRASFELAALVVSWVVIGLLVIVVGGLNARLRRLEQASAGPATAPYGHLIGRRLGDIVGADALRHPVRVLVFLSSGCGACSKLLEEIETQSGTVPAAIVWTDGSPPERARQSNVPLLAGGPRVAAELGIRVTPFALVADDQGTVVRAGPVSSLRSLGRELGRRMPVPMVSGVQ